MTEWTTARVEDRLESAADVFRTLPGVMPQGFFNAWPEYFHSFADKVGQEPQMRQPRPGPRQISEAEEALLWRRQTGPPGLRVSSCRSGSPDQRWPPCFVLPNRSTP